MLIDEEPTLKVRVELVVEEEEIETVSLSVHREERVHSELSLLNAAKKGFAANVSLPALNGDAERFAARLDDGALPSYEDAQLSVLAPGLLESMPESGIEGVSQEGVPRNVNFDNSVLGDGRSSTHRRGAGRRNANETGCFGGLNGETSNTPSSMGESEFFFPDGNMDVIGGRECGIVEAGSVKYFLSDSGDSESDSSVILSGNAAATTAVRALLNVAHLTLSSTSPLCEGGTSDLSSLFPNRFGVDSGENPKSSLSEALSTIIAG